MLLSNPLCQCARLLMILCIAGYMGVFAVLSTRDLWLAFATTIREPRNLARLAPESRRINGYGTQQASRLSMFRCNGSLAVYLGRFIGRRTEGWVWLNIIKCTRGLNPAHCGLPSYHVFASCSFWFRLRIIQTIEITCDSCRRLLYVYFP